MASCRPRARGYVKRELALFAGAGGGILGGVLLGWRTVCAVELDAYAAGVLVARQNDGTLPPFPVWDDVRTFDGRPWRGAVDVVSGGFPCQDISCAGSGLGIDGERSGLWREMARIVGEVRPRHVLVENSPLLVRRGLAVVLGDLASLGYDASWMVLGASDVGAMHQRKRMWVVASDSHNNRHREQIQQEQITRSKAEANHWSDGPTQSLADSDSEGKLQSERSLKKKRRWSCDDGWWSIEPDVGRVAYGMAHGLDRIRALGNGQVPIVAATAWQMMGDNL